ncbi:MAG: PLDc N-terminal domain-containing protein [Thermoplasmata archaeon]|nr:PLDc N-terminal domain-containing protein [Thermoplasmata archaeon]
MAYPPGEGVFMFSMCFGYIILIVIWIVVAVWVYRDAESRGMEGVLWLIVVLVAGIIGLIIYLIIRKDKPKPAQYGGYPYGTYPPYQSQYPYYGQPPQYGQQPPNPPKSP